MRSCGCREVGCPHLNISDAAFAAEIKRVQSVQCPGLYRKFDVRRTDGTSRKGQKHHGCHYFVLDLTHDAFAAAALLAYADACEAEYPELAAGIRKSIEAKRLVFGRCDQ